MDTKNTNVLLVLVLMDGRFEGDEQSKGLWGPVLTGITHVAYCNQTIRLYFDSIKSLVVAKNNVGWEQYDDNSLIMSVINDYVVTNVCISDSDARLFTYYGEWYITTAD